MQRGEIIAGGRPLDVIEQYKASAAQSAGLPFQGVGAMREWPEGARPGDAVVRLRRVRVCDEHGETTSLVDIRRPVGIEVMYDVLEAGHALLPFMNVYNEARLHLFTIADVGPEWRRRPQPVGRHVRTAWIPENLLSEGSLLLDAGISVHIPVAAIHIFERGVVAFRVVDTLSGESARGDYTGPMPGLIRPLVKWTTRVDSGDPDRQREPLETLEPIRER